MTIIAAESSVLASPTWVLIITLILGNGTFLTILVTGILNRRKTAAEAGKADAESDVASSTATEALVRTSLSLLQPYTEGLTRFSEEATRLRVENEALRRQQEELRREIERLRVEQAELNLQNKRMASEVDVLRLHVRGLTKDVTVREIE